MTFGISFSTPIQSTEKLFYVFKVAHSLKPNTNQNMFSSELECRVELQFQMVHFTLLSGVSGNLFYGKHFPS